MNLTTDTVAFHRNGICGAPFHAVLFWEHGPPPNPKLGIVFDAPGAVAVLDLAKLLDGDVAFGFNSWRGDAYEPHLRRLVQEYEAALAAVADGADRV